VLGDEQAQNGEKLKRLKNSETYKLRKLKEEKEKSVLLEKCYKG